MFLSLLKLITERPQSELTFLTEIHNKRGLVGIFFYFAVGLERACNWGYTASTPRWFQSNGVSWPARYFHVPFLSFSLVDEEFFSDANGSTPFSKRRCSDWRYSHCHVFGNQTRISITTQGRLMFLLLILFANWEGHAASPNGNNTCNISSNKKTSTGTTQRGVLVLFPRDRDRQFNTNGHFLEV